MMSVSQINLLSADLSNQFVRPRNIVNGEPVQSFEEQVRNIQNTNVGDNDFAAPRADIREGVRAKNLRSVEPYDNREFNNVTSVNEFMNSDKPSPETINKNEFGIDNTKTLNIKFIDSSSVNAVVKDQTNSLGLTYDNLKNIINNSSLIFLQSSTSSNSTETRDLASLEALRDVESYIVNDSYEIEEKADDLTVHDQSPGIMTMSAQTSVLLLRPHDDLKTSDYNDIKNFNDDIFSPELLKTVQDATWKTQGAIPVEELNTNDDFKLPLINDRDAEIDTDLLKTFRALTQKMDSNPTVLSSSRAAGVSNTQGQTTNITVTDNSIKPDLQAFVSNTLFLQEQNSSIKLNDYSKEFISSSIDATLEVSFKLDSGNVREVNLMPLDAEAHSDETIDRPSLASTTNNFQSMNDFLNIPKSLSTSPISISETFTKQLAVQHPETAEKISLQLLQVSGLQGDKPGKMTLQMTPESMGRMEVTFERSLDGRIDAVVNIHNADTYDLFRNDQQELRQAIADAFNVDQDSLNFNLNQQQQQTSSDATFIVDSDDKTNNQQSDEYVTKEIIDAYHIDNNRVLDRRI